MFSRPPRSDIDGTRCDLPNASGSCALHRALNLSIFFAYTYTNVELNELARTRVHTNMLCVCACVYVVPRVFVFA